MAVYTETIGSELYVYINGKLTMKRWIKEERSVVFTPFPYDKHTAISITDKGVIDRTQTPGRR
jgi:hypothetical protein